MGRVHRAPPVLITFSGCPNFRDLGGHSTTDGRRVRTGRIFRSDSLHGLTDDDLTEVRRLGVVTVYDLRMQDEIDEYGVGPLYDGERAARYVHAPLFQTTPAHWLASDEPYNADRVGREYSEMLELGAGSIRRIAADLGCEDNLPAVIHCMAGRDRTGTVAAVLLSVLGVDDETITADYAVTGERLPDDGLVAGAVEVLLAHIQREHGSAAGYLHSVGASHEQVDALRLSLLE